MVTNNPEVQGQWQDLCDRHEHAKAEYEKAFAVVNQHFLAIGSRRSTENPSDEALEKSRSAWEKLTSIRAEMDLFVKNHVK